ncbi:hypothetical protein HRH59_03770 [Rheinheimera sp. YQF-2]|uniref:Uncharacterized protein n=1 Tax=Rheinheimera lutimaris TaxID=2740584 RepID=A0A7Y5ANK0_9GAMM|nr:hypothetical protein [Rheinheimera lutimaris]NRQ41688.1 hypothetical protein [Rheinheimera lutimaris]
MKSKKLETLVNVYKELAEELGKLNSPELEPLLNSWSVSLGQVNEIISNPDNAIKPSQLASGFEQGLRDMHLMLSDLNVQYRSPAIGVFYKIVGLHLPGFFQKSKAQLQRIVAKGQIKNENEWYLVRHRVDEIECQLNNEAELAVLNELLGNFEASV